MHPEWWLLITLGLVAFLAASVDAIAGGGGLINVPALLLAGLPVPVALGTNKLAGIAGQISATATFAAARAIRWQLVTTGALAAFAGALLGTHTVLHVDQTVLRIIVSILLLLVSTFAGFQPRLGTREGAAVHRSVWRSAAIGFGTGFYDGFFGPGTGMFMIFLLVAWLGLDFLAASGAAKVMNFGSNLGSVIIFAAAGSIDYRIGVAMAAGAIAGGVTGSRLAIVRGAPFVKYVFLAVAWLAAGRLLWQALHR